VLLRPKFAVAIEITLRVHAVVEPKIEAIRVTLLFARYGTPDLHSAGNPANRSARYFMRSQRIAHSNSSRLFDVLRQPRAFAFLATPFSLRICHIAFSWIGPARGP
jgi:hypothetical protein